MKKILFSALAAGTGAFALSAHATSQINFDGEVVAETCETNVNGVPTPTPVNVSLPHVSVNALAAAGARAGETRFTVGLANCVGALTTAAAHFEDGPSVTPEGRLRNMTGTATNVELELTDENNAGASIKVGDANQRTNTQHGAIVGGALSLPYGVQYYATDAATPGTVNSLVRFTVDYQ